MPREALRLLENTASDLGIFRRRVSPTSVFFAVEGKKREEFERDVGMTVRKRREETEKAIFAETEQAFFGKKAGIIVEFKLAEHERDTGHGMAVIPLEDIPLLTRKWTKR
ncbi:Uncharacterised protein [Candidatus Norongarragalina meridionalis]|nr:Uncharacterised protein [Candidatus Norongarragalina meridionalis]